MRRTPTTRSAFGTLLTVILLGLVSVALAVMVTVSRGDYLRTESSVSQAQLRQMILAGLFDANSRAAHWTQAPQPQQWTTNLPGGGGAIDTQILVQSPTQMRVNITARLGKHQLQQSLQYVYYEYKWELLGIS